MFFADYCFIKTNAGVSDAGEQFATTLVVVDKDTGAVAAMSLPSKVARPLATEFVASFIDRCGLTKVTSRTDGEASMASLAEKVKDKREHGTILQQAPKHSSASIGAVGRARWEIQAQTRTMKTRPLELTRSPRWRMTRFPWIASHASWLMTRFLVQARGTTAYVASTARSIAGRSLPSAKP